MNEHTPLDMLNEVRSWLNSSKGQWPAIAHATDLEYSWLQKMAQGQINDPGVKKIQRLYAYQLSLLSAAAS